MQKVVISKDIKKDIQEAYDACKHDKTFVLCDETTAKLCLETVGYEQLTDNRIRLCGTIEAELIVIPAGDDNKTIDSISLVWEALSTGGATRHSLLINIAGGMVTDLGGFAAATFKRGINFINIPTTLLSQVDASVGGKTGINFCGYKNEIGAFCDAETVIISSAFLKTLDSENMLSGYAEMLKHALLKDKTMLAEHLNFDIAAGSLTENDYEKLQQMVAESIAVKQKIVEEDPHEKGIRKALNLGHTFGHAFESWAMRHNCPRLHGYAVAWGMICELYLSAKKCGFPTDTLHQVASFIKENYGKLAISCDDYPELLELMTHDKKNTDSHSINFTLLADIGDIKINQTATKKEIEDALDFYLF
ncbi:MAG: 3-dehydroquinate synthase [Bacteroidaceae bacterium]|nr:3-dehydroquinate synthase [Bacteroidaceae bacterium]